MNFLRLGIRLLDSLWRHKNDSEDISIMVFGNISLKFATGFVFFKKIYILSFSELIDLQEPKNFFEVLQT